MVRSDIAITFHSLIVFIIMVYSYFSTNSFCIEGSLDNGMDEFNRINRVFIDVTFLISIDVIIFI